MALTAVELKPPTTTAAGRKLPGFSGFSLSRKGGNRRHCRVFHNSAGTSGTLDTKMKSVLEIIIIEADGVTVDPSATATKGRVTTGTYTSTIASLTAADSYIIVIGDNK